MAKARKNSFFGGAAILAVGIAAVKIIGALFKIPIVGILGDAYADFANAYNIYSVLLTISTAGLPVALSKLVAAADALGRARQVRKTFLVSLAVFLSLGTLSFLVMFLGADLLAGLLNDPMAATAIRFLAPAVVCVSCLSSFRGYTQGHSNMTPSAISQVIEALCKLLIGLPLAYAAVRMGVREDVSAGLAILGVTIGSALALAYMIFHFFRTRPPLTGPAETSSVWVILRDLLIIAIPITFTSSAMSIITVVDSSVVQGQLQNALGMSLDQSRSLYSAYSGVLTIYNLPSAFILAVTASVIPAVSAALARRERQAASRVVRAAFHITALLVMPMGVGMSVLGKPIVRLLFRSMDPDLSGPMLSILGIAAVFVCLVAVSNSILQAYGYQYIPILVMVSAGATMILLDFFLVAIPAVNIFGSPIGTLFCYVSATVADLIIIRKVVPHPPRYLRLFFGPVLATAIMALVAWGSYTLLSLLLSLLSPLPLLTNVIPLIAAILLAVAAYGGLVILLRLLDREELKLMPKGEKLADLLRLP